MALQDEILTVAEVAELLKVSKLTVYRIRDRGELPFFKAGRHYRCKRSDLEAYITRQAAQPKAVKTPD